MAKKFPEIVESSEELLERMKREKHVLKRQRLHTLYLVKSGQAGSRQEIAQLLGIGGNAVGEWLNCYAREGLDVLLEVKVPPGRVASLNPAQQEQLREALACPTGFSSFVDVQTWIKEQLGIQMEYSAVHKLVKYSLGASLKVARPSHPQKT